MLISLQQKLVLKSEAAPTHSFTFMLCTTGIKDKYRNAVYTISQIKPLMGQMVIIKVTFIVYCKLNTNTERTADIHRGASKKQNRIVEAQVCDATKAK